MRKTLPNYSNYTWFLRQKGFTLIELLIATAVLGVLLGAIVLIINPTASIDKARDAQRKSDLNAVQKVLELYHYDNGRYPPSSATYTINGVPWGGDFSPYMRRLPRDPNTARRYVYSVSADGQTYWLYANLARGRNDPQSCALGGDCNNVPAVNQCGSSSPCNYGVTSANTTP